MSSIDDAISNESPLHKLLLKSRDSNLKLVFLWEIAVCVSTFQDRSHFFALGFLLKIVVADVFCVVGEEREKEEEPVNVDAFGGRTF